MFLVENVNEILGIKTQKSTHDSRRDNVEPEVLVVLAVLDLF